MKDYSIRHYRTNQILKLEGNTAGIEVIRKKYGERFIYKIDSEDTCKVQNRCWHYHEGYCTTVDNGKQINLSVLLLGKPPTGHVVHHVNGDKTDYRKQNLRKVTWGLNNYFKSYQRNRSTGIRGVHHYRSGIFVANFGARKIVCKSLEEAKQIRKLYDDAMHFELKPGHPVDLIQLLNLLQTGKKLRR